MKNEPAYIDIVFEDHTYTATVYEMRQLLRFCSDCVRSRREFRFGSIHQFGSINLDVLVCTMNQIRHFGTYSKDVGRIEN